MEGLRPRPVPRCMLHVIASAAAAAAGSASSGQSLTPQPLVQTMERISVVGPGQVDAQGAPLAETARERLSELPRISAHLVSAPAHDSGGLRAAADFGSFNPHLRAERIHPDTQDPDASASMLTLRVAFESYAMNLDPSITDGNNTRDIYYAELVVPVPDTCSP